MVTSLSQTAQAILATAAANSDHIVILPERLPIAARRAVAQSMLKAGVIDELPAKADQPAWRTAESGERIALRATQAGLVAIGGVPAHSVQDGLKRATQPGSGAVAVDSVTQPEVGVTACALPPSPRTRLRVAAEALVTAWDDTTNGRPGLPAALDMLRSAMALAKPASSGAPRPPRAGTKQQAVLTLLRRSEGASVAHMAEATGWASHTVRGFLAGLKKKGVMVEVLERVRQAGSGKAGGRGSYALYRVTEAG